jgi:geranyl-CoA carboxylase alpha subunit
MPAVRHLLIANRGEIAVRIARTARALGCRTIAVYSDADADARHVGACDTAVRIGPAPVADSYVSIAAILDAARRSGADAVHPGYGFLSENPVFAAAVVAAGLTFVGPSAAAIEAMGNKALAKRRMLAAGVPCVPGYEGEDQTEATLVREAARIGYPVMLKAAAGGGGRGMRLVTGAAELPAAIVAARSEAERAFGSGELILEKAVVGGRHVEIQVFGDGHGQIIHLGERDCSVQRRHQKVIEEAPSPAVCDELRARMGAAAVTAAAAIGYVGAGTIEFLLAADGSFYFLEMNTRLQVEHPVTELITGQDLVAWQIRIARGEALPLRQADLRLEGHAMEARLYAEDPAQGFLPQSGEVLVWRAPRDVRCESGLKSRDRVSPDYDPMLAKIIVHGDNREDARRRLVAALDETVALGLTTNRSYLRALLTHPAFVAGAAATDFIPRHLPTPPPAPALEPAQRAIAAALLVLTSGEVPESTLAGWSSTGRAGVPVLLDDASGEPPQRLRLEIASLERVTVVDGALHSEVTLARRSAETLRVRVDGQDHTVVFARADEVLHLQIDGRQFTVQDGLRRARSRAGAAGGDEMRAPMNGRVVRIAARAGELVRKGQTIVVLEAMKMQHEIAAPRDGCLDAVVVAEGQQVATRAMLASMRPD